MIMGEVVMGLLLHIPMCPGRVASLSAVHNRLLVGTIAQYRCIGNILGIC